MPVTTVSGHTVLNMPSIRDASSIIVNSLLIASLVSSGYCLPEISGNSVLTRPLILGPLLFRMSMDFERSVTEKSQLFCVEVRRPI